MISEQTQWTLALAAVLTGGALVVRYNPSEYPVVDYLYGAVLGMVTTAIIAKRTGESE